MAKSLFALDGLWPPYHDRLWRGIDLLESQPAQTRRWLKDTFLEIARTADPSLQQELQQRAEAVLASRGFTGLLDEWEGEIEWARSIDFGNGHQTDSSPRRHRGNMTSGKEGRS